MPLNKVTKPTIEDKKKNRFQVRKRRETEEKNCEEKNSRKRNKEISIKTE